MADLLFVGIIVAFFGVAVLLVRACDAIIGPDPAPSTETTEATETAPDATEAVSTR